MRHKKRGPTGSTWAVLVLNRFSAVTLFVLQQRKLAAAQNGRDPLAERGRLVDSARGHVRDASQTMPKGMRKREGWVPLAKRGLCWH